MIMINFYDYDKVDNKVASAFNLIYLILFSLVLNDDVIFGDGFFDSIGFVVIVDVDTIRI